MYYTRLNVVMFLKCFSALHGINLYFKTEFGYFYLLLISVVLFSKLKRKNFLELRKKRCLYIRKPGLP